MEIVLIRHTAAAVKAGTCYGHLDLPLAPGFANDIATALVAIARADAIFSSPSQRCVALAESLATRDARPLTLVPALQELSFGAWEGMPWAQIPRTLSDPWAQDPWNRAPPGGETEQALWQRVDAWRLQTLQGLTGRIAIVAHAGSLRALRGLLLGVAPPLSWSWTIGYGEARTITTDLMPGS
jgi:alpha-ribazole phosphatase